MPEQLTKHPEVTLQVLRSAGAQCGSGTKPDILKGCPAERFCQLPGGEICVYGLADAKQMTQLTPSDWQTVVQAVASTGPPPRIGTEALAWEVGLVLLGLLLGGVLGWAWRRRR
jgi:hypothetical protein